MGRVPNAVNVMPFSLPKLHYSVQWSALWPTARMGHKLCAEFVHLTVPELKISIFSPELKISIFS